MITRVGHEDALELTKNKQIAMTSAHMIDTITYTIIQTESGQIRAAIIIHSTRFVNKLL